VIALIVKSYSSKEIEECGDDLARLFQSKTDFETVKCLDIVDMSSRNPFFPIDEKASLQDAIDMIVRWGVHRLPVVNSEGELVTLLTQSHIISFLQKNISQFPFASKKLSELNLGVKEVISAHMSDKAVDAFKIIAEKKKFKVLRFWITMTSLWVT